MILLLLKIIVGSALWIVAQYVAVCMERKLHRKGTWICGVIIFVALLRLYGDLPRITGQ